MTQGADVDAAARLAGADDTADLARLVRLARAAAAGQRGGAAWLATVGPTEPVTEWVANRLDGGPGGTLLVGTFDGVPVGVVGLAATERRDGGRVTEVDVLYVEPDAREVGVGEALVEAMLAWAGDHGCASVEAVALPGDRQLKNLFERFGLVARAIVVRRELP